MVGQFKKMLKSFEGNDNKNEGYEHTISPIPHFELNSLGPRKTSFIFPYN